MRDCSAFRSICTNGRLQRFRWSRRLRATMQHLHLQLREVHEDSDHYFADSTVITRKYLTGPNRAHQSTRKYCICQRQVYQLRGQTTSQGRYSG